MPVCREFLENLLFADIPVNWLIHARDFYHAALKTIEAYEKLYPKKQFLSPEDIFNQRYTYKIGIYLLCHALELLLKSFISAVNHTDENILPKPIGYNHKVSRMIDDLIRVKALDEKDRNQEIIKFVEEYLQWFGRYFSPSNISKTIKESYIDSNENGLIKFKYEITYPEAHLKLVKLFEELNPNIPENQLTMPYLFHTP